MGSNLTSLKKKTNNPGPFSELKINLIKLQEYHSNFRMICNSFTIDLKELSDIFSKANFFDALKLFANGDDLIDGLELFSCLIIFSEDAFVEKVKFLFDIFDFNDLNILSITDFEFMLNCIISSTFKILGVSSPLMKQPISRLCTKYFNRLTQINISHIISFSIECEEITEFFKIIKKIPPCKETLSKNEQILKTENKESSIPEYLLRKKFRFNYFVPLEEHEYKDSGQIAFSQLTKKKNQLVSSLIKRIKMDQIQTFAVTNSCLRLDWIHGSPSGSQVQSFFFHESNSSKKNKNGDRKLVYSVGNIVIVFYYKTNQQSHYKEHANRVNCISLSSKGNLVASGDQGISPKIHIWEIETFKTIALIQTIPDCHVYLMCFVKDDRYLVCLSKRYNPPICIYDIKNNNVIFQSHVNEFILLISPFECLAGRMAFEDEVPISFTHSEKLENGLIVQKEWLINASFVCNSSQKIYFYMFNIQEEIFDLLSFDYTDELKEEAINSVLALFLHKSTPKINVLGSDSDYRIVIFVGGKSGNLIKTLDFQHKNSVTSEIVYNFGKSIVQMKYFNENFIIVGLENGSVKIFDFTQNNIVFEFNLADLGLKLEDLEIKNLEKGSTNSIFIFTFGGDLLKISIPQKNLFKNSGLQKSLKRKQFHQIGRLSEDLVALCVIERDNMVDQTETDVIIYAASKNGKVYGFSEVSKRIVDIWFVEDEITAIDSFVSCDKNIIFGVGLKNGQIYIRYDWEVYFKSFNCEDKVTCLKFSPNGIFLIAGSAQYLIYIFNFAHGTIFEYNPKEVQFQNEIPLSINFSQDSRCFIVGTHEFRYYEVTVEGKKTELIADNSKIQVPLLNLKYSLIGFEKKLPCLMDSTFGMVIMGEREGVVSVFNSLPALERNLATYYYGHNGHIADLILAKEKKKLFTISEDTGAIFVWKIALDYSHLESKHSLSSGFSITNVANYPSITRAIIVCSNIFPKLESKEDSFSYFRGFSNPFLRKVFGEKQSSIEKNTYLPKRYPETSIKLSHVYGFEAYDLRDSIVYVEDNLLIFEKNLSADSVLDTRDFSWKSSLTISKNLLKIKVKTPIIHEKNKKNISKPNCSEPSENQMDELNNRNTIEEMKSKDDLSINNPIVDKDQYLKLRFAKKKSPNREDERIVASKHSERDFFEKNESKTDSDLAEKPNQKSENRLIVYIISRVCVIISPKSPNQQLFYQGHRSKVSCLTVHSLFRLIASCEATINPQIHVWNPFSRQSLSVINTHHRLGVIAIKFSLIGRFVYTVSVDTFNSIQISNWEHGEITAFRNTSQKQIVGIDVNPDDHKRFVTASRGSIDFWKLSGHSIVHIKMVDLTSLISDHFVTCVCFFDYKLQNSRKHNIFFGTSIGIVGVIGKYECVLSKTLTESISINVVKLVEIANNFLIFVGSNDSFIRILDKKLELKQSIKIPSFPADEFRSIGIQSFDLAVNVDTYSLLCGLKVGRIVEFEYDPKPDFQQQEAKIVSPVFRNLVFSHSNQNYSDPKNEYNYIFKKKVFVSMHPAHLIFVSVGSDKILKVFDFENRVQLQEVNLASYLTYKGNFDELNPTCTVFSIKGDNLVIGFDNGSILILKIVITRNIGVSSANHKATIGKNGQVISEEKMNAAILNIQFSPKGNFMAVSFDNKRTSINKASEISEKTGAVIVIYEVSRVEVAQGTESKFNCDTLYQKRRELRLASLDLPEISKMSILGNANYFMSFSEDEFFLIVYYQNINNNLVRENQDKGGRFMVWNHETAAIEMNWEILKNIDFKNNNFANQFYGVRIYQKFFKFSTDALQIVNHFGKIGEIHEKKIVLSSVNGRNNKVFFMGSEEGEILICKQSLSSLSTEQNPEDLSLSEFCQARKYQAHTSFVNQIEFNTKETVLLTSSLSDECIFQWEISQIGADYELDHKEIDISMNDDQFQEIFPFETFEELISGVYQKRIGLTKSLTNVDLGIVPIYRLTLKKVIGRNSFRRRSNISMTSNNQLVYSAGTIVIILDMSQRIKLEICQKKTSFGDQRQSEEMINDSQTNSEKMSTWKNSHENPTKEIIQHAQLDSDNSSKKSVSGNRNSESSVNQNSNYSEKSKLSMKSASDKIVNLFFKNKSEENKIQDSQENKTLFQEFLNLEFENTIQASGEVSCIELAFNQTTLCFGTNEAQSVLNFWEVTSKSFLGKVLLGDCVSVIFVRFSFDSKFVMCAGLNYEYKTTIYYISVNKMEVLSFLTLNYSTPHKIKDCAFVHSKNNEFVTVGLIHATNWFFKGGVLNFKELKFEEPFESIKNYRNDAKTEGTSAIHSPGFLVIRYLSANIFVTGCMKGFVYGWKNKDLLVKRSCYRTSPVTVIAQSPVNSLDFLVCGYGVPLLIYRISKPTSSLIKLNPIFMIPIFESQIIDQNLPEFQLQSLIWVESGYIIIGTRSGNIIESVFDSVKIEKYNRIENQISAKDDLSFLTPKESIRNITVPLLQFCNQEVPRAVDFSRNLQFVFLLTENGPFFIYEFKTLKLIKRIDFANKAVTMLVLSDMIILVFERKIITLDCGPAFERMLNYEKDTLVSIHKAKINTLQDMIVLALNAESDIPFMIEVYKIEDELTKFFSVQTDEICLLDFSVNNLYLMYQELNGKSFILNLTVSKLEVQMLDNDDPIEWMGDGFHLNEKRKFIGSSYNEDSEIVNIIKIGERALAVSDELGTVS